MSKFTYTVQPLDEENNRSVKVLVHTHFNMSSRLKKKIKRDSLLLLNGISVKNHILPKAGDVLTISWPEESSYFPPEDIPLDILYEDEDLLILNKQAGIVVHPTNGHPIHTLANGIMKYILDSQQQFKIRFINRLDMDTSGVILIGKNSHAQDNLTKQMKEGSVEKIYTAIVKGHLLEKEGIIDLPIGRPDPERVQRGVMLSGGSPSITHFLVLEELNPSYSLVQLRIETGRTHQIRVHLSHLGHPVLGDHLYGGDNIHLIQRQALHSTSMIFNHPVTGISMKITAPIPPDMEEVLKRLRLLTL